jgi:preprotein translocase subunit SecG
MAILSILLTVIIVAVSILMVMIVLIQRPKQEGLGAAFGGSTLDSALGAHTTDVLQKITTWLGIIFFVSAIGLAMVKTRQFQSTAASDVLEEVKDREPQLPGLPPELSNLPSLGTPAPAPVEEAPAAPATSLLDDDKVKDVTPAPAETAEEKPAPEGEAKGKGKANAKGKESGEGAKSKEGAKDGAE